MAFGFQLRTQLLGKVTSAFEDLITKLRYMIYLEHNENGTHRGVTYTGAVTSITVVNGIVTKVN